MVVAISDKTLERLNIKKLIHLTHGETYSQEFSFQFNGQSIDHLQAIFTLKVKAFDVEYQERYSGAEIVGVRASPMPDEVTIPITVNSAEFALLQIGTDIQFAKPALNKHKLYLGSIVCTYQDSVSKYPIGILIRSSYA